MSEDISPFELFHDSDEAPAPAPVWDGDPGTMPMYQRPFGPLVPDLSRIPRERWRSVLLPLSWPERRAAAYHEAFHYERSEVLKFVEALPEPFVESLQPTIRRGTEIPAPTAQRDRAGRQVNIRLQAEDYRRLVAAAEVLGTKPATVARILVNNGTRRVLADHAALVDDAR